MAPITAALAQELPSQLLDASQPRGTIELTKQNSDNTAGKVFASHMADLEWTWV